MPSHSGDTTFLSPQKSGVVPHEHAVSYWIGIEVEQRRDNTPQNPNLLQQTFNGQVEALDHCSPQPASHSLFLSQDEVHPFPQKSGPKPQVPLPVFWSLNGVSGSRDDEGCKSAGHTEAHSSQSRRGLTWNKRSYRLLLQCLVDVDTGKQRVLETRAQKAAGQGLRASWPLV